MRISGFLWPVLLLFGHGLNAHPAGRQPTVQQRKLAALAPMHLSGTVLLPCMYCCASTPSGVLRCTSECSRSPTLICGAPNLGQQGVNGGGAGRLKVGIVGAAPAKQPKSTAQLWSALECLRARLEKPSSCTLHPT